MRPLPEAGHAAAHDPEEGEDVPICLEDDASPAVDVLLAMATRC